MNPSEAGKPALAAGGIGALRYVSGGMDTKHWIHFDFRQTTG